MKLFCIIILFVFCDGLKAQEETHPSIKKFGFQAGANISNMNFNKGYMATPAHYSAAWKAGIAIGFLVKVPLSEKFFLQPEYWYTQRNGADKNLSINYAINYLSMPVLLNYKITPMIAVFAGPQLELMISAKSDNNGTSSSITHDTEERSIGIVGGVEADINKIFFFSARYLQGFNHIGIRQNTTVKEFQYQSVSITAGIRF